MSQAHHERAICLESPICDGRGPNSLRVETQARQFMVPPRIRVRVRHDSSQNTFGYQLLLVFQRRYADVSSLYWFMQVEIPTWTILLSRDAPVGLHGNLLRLEISGGSRGETPGPKYATSDNCRHSKCTVTVALLSMNTGYEKSHPSHINRMTRTIGLFVEPRR